MAPLESDSESRPEPKTQMVLGEAQAENSDSDSYASEVDSLEEDLDQIGRLNLPKLSEYIKRDSFPHLPTLPTFASFPNFPNLPPLPTLPTLPSPPNLPSFDLPDVSKYISQYVENVTRRASLEKDKFSLETEARLANSLKIALATRIQMATFLSDLKDGISFQTAIDRLQLLTDVVHEAITLPVDDDSEAELEVESEAEIETEPVGVDEIVHREQPLITELVFPENRSDKDPVRQEGKRKRKSRVRREDILSDGYDSSVYMGSDLENVEELSREEARALTHLDSLDDFYKEDLLRQKIQKIQRLEGLSQRLKNKLVTRLMMGNYYKYMDEHPGVMGEELVIPKESEKKEDEKDVQVEEKDRLETGGKDRLETGGKDRQEIEKTEEQDDQKDNFKNTDTDAQEVKADSKKASLLSKDHTVPSRQRSNSAASYASASSSSSASSEVLLTEEDQQPSFHSPGVLGCTHYQLNCKLECPTCLRWFPCRFCHDQEVTSHKLIRANVRHVLCMRCNVPQEPDTNYCVNCDEELASYFCAKCVLYDNDPAKHIYHCDKCGLCRLGLGLDKDYFHCDVCNICLLIDLREHHKCVTNTTHCNCPICSEYLFTSVSKVVFMQCGHLIHQSCYDEMVKHLYKCPVCKKTVVDAAAQFRILDLEIRLLPLPPPYNSWRCIISCNDCKGKSRCAYHIMGLKCKYCHSYNTNQLQLIKPEEAKEGTETEEEDAINNDRIASMRLIKTNLSSNFVVDERIQSEDDSGFGRMKQALLGHRDADGSIAGMFQAFVNSAIAGDLDLE